MKTLAIISSADETYNSFQYDKIIAALTFDSEVVVVFFQKSLQIMLEEKRWKSLPIYGVDEIYFFGDTEINNDFVKSINDMQFKKLVNEAELIL